MVALPWLAMRLEGTEALNCVLLTKVVAREEPFQRIPEPGRKFDPLAVSAKD